MTELQTSEGRADAPEQLTPRHDVLKALLDYWLEKKGDRRAPSRSDIDPLEIAPLLPFVMLIGVERTPLRFHYRLVGTEIVRNIGDDLTGHYLDEYVRLGRDAPMVRDYARVAAWGPPVCAVWEYTRDDGRHVRYERLALPLSRDGKTVDMLFGGAVFETAYG
ncbi:MAG TPA: PAS domain-containing protein [Alphaproteobacteria bacterium]